MRIGVPRERRDGEQRVALVPDVVAALVAQGHEVVVESGAGDGAGHDDAAYATAGATVAADVAGVEAAELIARVAPPPPEETARLRRGQAVVGFLNPLGDPAGIAALAAAGATALSMEPRAADHARAVHGRAQLAGDRCGLQGGAARGVAPGPHVPAPHHRGRHRHARARALVLGAGVAGLQAIATARRLGAIVEVSSTCGRP